MGRGPNTNVLTKLQAAVLDCMMDRVAANGFPPTDMEVSEAIDAPVNSVTGAIAALTRKGYLRRTPSISRGCTPVKDRQGRPVQLSWVRGEAEGPPPDVVENPRARPVDYKDPVVVERIVHACAKAGSVRGGARILGLWKDPKWLCRWVQHHPEVRRQIDAAMGREPARVGRAS